MSDLCHNCGDCHLPEPCCHTLALCEICGAHGHTFNFCPLGVRRIIENYQYWMLCHNCQVWHLPSPCTKLWHRCHHCLNFGHLEVFCPLFPAPRTRPYQTGVKRQRSDDEDVKDNQRLVTSAESVSFARQETTGQVLDLLNRGWTYNAIREYMARDPSDSRMLESQRVVATTQAGSISFMTNDEASSLQFRTQDAGILDPGLSRLINSDQNRQMVNSMQASLVGQSWAPTPEHSVGSQPARGIYVVSSSPVLAPISTQEVDKDQSMGTTLQQSKGGNDALAVIGQGKKKKVPQSQGQNRKRPAKAAGPPHVKTCCDACQTRKTRCTHGRAPKKLSAAHSAGDNDTSSAEKSGLVVLQLKSTSPLTSPTVDLQRQEVGQTTSAVDGNHAATGAVQGEPSQQVIGAVPSSSEGDKDHTIHEELPQQAISPVPSGAEGGKDQGLHTEGGVLAQ